MKQQGKLFKLFLVKASAQTRYCMHGHELKCKINTPIPHWYFKKIKIHFARFQIGRRGISGNKQRMSRESSREEHHHSS